MVLNPVDDPRIRAFVAGRPEGGRRTGSGHADHVVSDQRIPLVGLDVKAYAVPTAVTSPPP